MSTRPLTRTFSERTVADMFALLQQGRLNLEPGFQRRSVWTLRDRRLLIQSIDRGYPLPSIFLYRRNENGHVVYDVLDGKQRLETLFMFARQGRFARSGFDVSLDLGDGEEAVDWRTFQKHSERAFSFRSYQLQTVEVEGHLGDIVDLFVRINSTGKPLTSGEKRHARFFQSPFLKEAQKLVRKHRTFLREQRILTDAQLERMKGTELVSELLMSIQHGEVINKKQALDRALSNEAINGNTLRRLSAECTATLNTVRRMFPELGSTRFHNSADFYSLFMLVWEMRRDRLVLSDPRRNRTAQALLVELTRGVDELRMKLRKHEAPSAGQTLSSDYLHTIQGDTDSKSSRTRRREILRGLLGGLFEKKDAKRAFSLIQRRLLWHADAEKRCVDCKDLLTWDNFTVDHVKAFSKGGKTSLANARLLCRSCNSAKGARSVRRGRVA